MLKLLPSTDPIGDILVNFLLSVPAGFQMYLTLTISSNKHRVLCML